jgi:hypothetical protein
MANLAPIGPLHQPNYYVRFDSGHLPGLQHFNITGSTAFLTAPLGMKLEAVRFPFCHAARFLRTLHLVRPAFCH